MEDDKVLDQAKKLDTELQNVLDRTFVENLVKDNTIEFERKGVQYRVRLPKYKERQEANKKRAEKYLELLGVKNSTGEYIYKSETDLRKLYRDRGDDIEALENQFNTLETQKNIFKEKLGKALIENKPDSELEEYKTEILNIQKQQQELSMKKTVLLEFSFENQLMQFIYTYLAFLTTEKFENDTWVRLWNTFEEFENDSTSVLNLAIFYTTLLTSTETL